MEEFKGTTYAEWLEHHRKYGYPTIVGQVLESIKNEGWWKGIMTFGKIKEQK